MQNHAGTCRMPKTLKLFPSSLYITNIKNLMFVHNFYQKVSSLENKIRWLEKLKKKYNSKCNILKVPFLRLSLLEHVKENNSIKLSAKKTISGG